MNMFVCLCMYAIESKWSEKEEYKHKDSNLESDIMIFFSHIFTVIKF